MDGPVVFRLTSIGSKGCSADFPQPMDGGHTGSICYRGGRQHG